MESNEQNKENRCIDREQTDTYQREGVCWVKKVKGLRKQIPIEKDCNIYIGWYSIKSDQRKASLSYKYMAEGPLDNPFGLWMVIIQEESFQIMSEYSKGCFFFNIVFRVAEDYLYSRIFGVDSF